jgi:alpha-D-ribose 1-methylphosphonate 5-triphosphate diphosphatase
MSQIPGIAGARVLFPDGSFEVADVQFDGQCIATLGGSASRGSIDAEGLLLLPGIIDFHGDAFERQLAPRPEVRFPLQMAMHDTDRQLLANGITTAFHGVTCSWEGGLRGTDTARSIIDMVSLSRERDPSEPGVKFGADHRIHLRFENHHVDAAEDVVRWLDAGAVDFLAFNDHLPGIHRRLDDEGRTGKYAERAGVSAPAFRRIVEQARERSAEVGPTVARLASAAAARNVRMASHDDTTAEDRDRYQALGCRISEFPMREAAARRARELGNEVVMGCPNVVRGGSHTNGVRAADMVAAGLCTVLASDYFYPAMLAAPFRLAADGVASLGEAWQLVSQNAARATGQSDRGEIREGLRADVVLVDDSEPTFPRVVATLVGGELRHVVRHLAGV